MLKAIHSQEDREAALDKAKAVAIKLEAMKLHKAASVVREGIHETLRYYNFRLSLGVIYGPIIR